MVTKIDLKKAVVTLLQNPNKSCMYVTVSLTEIRTNKPLAGLSLKRAAGTPFKIWFVSRRNSQTASSFCCVPECIYVAVYVCMCECVCWILLPHLLLRLFKLLWIKVSPSGVIQQKHWVQKHHSLPSRTAEFIFSDTFQHQLDPIASQKGGLMPLQPHFFYWHWNVSFNWLHRRVHKSFVSA